MLFFAGTVLFAVSGILLAGGLAGEFGRAGPAGCPAFAAETEVYGRGKLTFVTAGGRRDFAVEIMRAPCDLQRGLMDRRSLPRDQGMMFEFPSEGFIPMWMKNTYIPLDMVFLEHGKVVSV